MRRSSLTRACYVLLLACIPASMVLVLWLSPGTQEWMIEHARRLHTWMFRHVYPFLPSWPQYFAVQTLAAVLAVCGAALVLSRRAADRGTGGRFRWGFPALVAGYAAWAGLSYFWSAWPYGTRAYFVREVPFYFLCVAAYFLCGRPQLWVTVAKVFAVSAFVEAALQGFVILTQYSSGTVEPMPGRELTLGYVFLKRAIFYSNRNFGSALVLTASFATVGLLAARLLPAPRPEGEEPPPNRRVALPLAGAAVALSVLVTIFLAAGSLAGYLAAAVAGGAYVFCLLPRRGRMLLGGAVGAVAVAGIITTLASDRLWTSATRALLSPHRTTHLRVIDWLTARELYVRKPIQGWGMGTFPATHARFFPPLARKLPFLKDKQTTHPHNEFARVASEQGSVGLLLYLALLGCAFVVSYRALRTQPLRTRLVGYALWAGGLTFIVQGAFGKAPMNWSFATNFWLLLGVLASARHWSGKPESEDQDEPVHLAPAGWLALLAVACAVGWFWWEWAWGGYASMVTFHHAHVAQLHLHEKEGQEERFHRFTTSVELSRPRFLWPDEMIHADYVVGWFLTRQGKWASAARQLEQMQRTVPEFQKTRLFLAECYRNMEQPTEARAQLTEYLARDPYDLAAYDVLARMDPEAAIDALAVHVLPRLSRPADWIVEDYPEPDEVKKLLHYYVASRRTDAARDLVERVQRFFTDELRRQPYDVKKLVRSLEQKYRDSDKDELAERLRQMLPQVWDDG